MSYNGSYSESIAPDGCDFSFPYKANYTNKEEFLDQLLFSEFENFVHRVILPIILIAGFSTNSAFLFVVFRVPSMRTVVNQYLTHIAIADLIFLLSSIAKKIVLFSATTIRYDMAHCWGLAVEILSHVLMYTTIFASVLIMTLVGFERFYAVCRPMRIYAATANQRKVKLLLGIVWTISVILALTTIPAMAQAKVACIQWPPEYSYFPNETTIFSSISSVAHVYTCLVQTVPFFIVMGINSVLYIKMVTTMTGRLGTMQAHDLDTQTNIDIRNKVAVMLIINGVAFFVLTFPFQFGSFLSAISAMSSTEFLFAIADENIVKLTCQLLLYTNSVINPIIYNVANSRYRASFKTAFGIDTKFGIKCFWRRDVSTGPQNIRNGRESPTKQTITTTYSNSFVVNANGETLLESDTKC